MPPPIIGDCVGVYRIEPPNTLMTVSKRRRIIKMTSASFMVCATREVCMPLS